MPISTLAYRKQYQEQITPARYSGKRHIAIVLLVGTILITALLFRFAPEARPVDWLVVPLTLVMASFVEYWVHRVVMHHPIPGLRAAFERHARRHHRYFTPEAMTFTSDRDLHAVLFPPVLLVLFATIAALLGALVALIWNATVGALFAATALAYYMAYETLHFSYHLAERVPGSRWRWLAFLARHHRLHHDPRQMLACNFNLVFPLFDWVFGTLRTRPMAPAKPDSIESTTKTHLAQSDKIGMR